jgi:hypothetical protein
VTLFVRVKFLDDTEEDNLVYLKREEVDPFIAELVEREDIQEAWVFEQIHHHQKACTKSNRLKGPPLVLKPGASHI